jgi:SAM-dependent methyltransferase
MSDEDAGTMFRGPIPDAYEDLMVPLFFQPFADDLVARAVALEPVDVLEVAAGTGVVTRGLVGALPGGSTIVATDLNSDMLAVAEAHEDAREEETGEVTWGVADAQRLPFDDASFDLVVCQFGVMFFRDRPGSHAEVLRVLRPGGTYIFSAWDSIEGNAIPRAVDTAFRRVLPDAPTNVVTRVSHGYHDVDRIRADLEAGGLVLSSIDMVELVASADSAKAAAAALPNGGPLRVELDGYHATAREEIETIAAEILEDEFGTGPLRAPMRAYVVTASRP